jgi:hypothetical protein
MKLLWKGFEGNYDKRSVLNVNHLSWKLVNQINMIYEDNETKEINRSHADCLGQQWQRESEIAPKDEVDFTEGVFDYFFY